MNKRQALVERSLKMMMGYPKAGFARKIKNLIKKMIGRPVNKRNPIAWPNGLCAMGLMEYVKAYPKNKDVPMILKSLEQYFDRWIDSGAKIGRVEDVLSGYVLLEMSRFKSKYEDRYISEIESFVNFLKNARRDRIGSYIYNPKDKNDIVLADTIGMVCPFMSASSDPILEQMAILQIENYMNNTRDPKSGLPYHGYEFDIESGNVDKLGIIGWGRTLGWTMMGISLTLCNLGPMHRDYAMVREHLIQLLLAVHRYRDPGRLFEWQIGQRGQKDTSGSAMIAYSLMKAINEDIISEDDEEIFECAEDVIRDVMRGIKSHIQKDGNVDQALAECLGPGIHPQEYGSYPWSVGPALALMSVYSL